MPIVVQLRLGHFELEQRDYDRQRQA